MPDGRRRATAFLFVGLWLVQDVPQLLTRVPTFQPLAVLARAGRMRIFAARPPADAGQKPSGMNPRLLDLSQCHWQSLGE